MKINPITNPNILRSYLGTKPAGLEKERAVSGRDQVTFSSEALTFSKAMTEAKEAIETRTPEERARIADIAAAIRQGEYHVDSDKVAEKILESVFRK